MEIPFENIDLQLETNQSKLHKQIRIENYLDTLIWVYF